jgi:hypothetical protein
MSSKSKSVKFIFKLFFLQAIIATSIGAVSAQSVKNSVYAVDFVKINDGEQVNYLKFIEQNWAKARAFMKEKGIVVSYQTLSIPASKNAHWDALLITEYVDQNGFESREKVFEEYRKTNAATPVNGKTAREMSQIKFSRTFNQAISNEVWEIMLKTQSDKVEEAAARVPLENYLKGHATGNPEFMRKAFYTEGKLIFVREGKYSTRTFEEYIAGMKDGKPAADEAQRKRWIESVDVAGNAAIGKIILDYPTVRFVDYMTLLKIDGEWKIVNKSFYAEPKQQATK